MGKSYIDVPKYTTFNEMEKRGFTFSATQYKIFCINNLNTCSVREFLDRELKRSDLGFEVGSDEYIDSSKFTFIKTKALQKESYLMNESHDATESIKPQAFRDMNLKSGDLLISKDSNVGEIIILDKDYPKAMLCGGIYRLPVTKNKYYLIAFIKNEIFRQQIDYLVPRGSTIRHGKTKFLECRIPMPTKNSINVVAYIETLMRAIINKEIAIRDKYRSAMSLIYRELLENQKESPFSFSMPTVNEILLLDRMDSSLYSEQFKKKEFLIQNYKYGCKTVADMGFKIKRGQNLQISNIGKSVQSKIKRKGYYTLILPNYISKYGTVERVEYLGNMNSLKTLNVGDVIFGAEGNEKGRSTVIIEHQDNVITNIHGITLNQLSGDVTKGVFLKLFLDYYRANGMIDAYAVGGNGGSMAIKYWDLLKFPMFPSEAETNIVNLYYSKTVYSTDQLTLKNFLSYDNLFNKKAGIFELDKSMKYLQAKLNSAIQCIADDIEVAIKF